MIIPYTRELEAKLETKEKNLATLIELRKSNFTLELQDEINNLTTDIETIKSRIRNQNRNVYLPKVYNDKFSN